MSFFLPPRRPALPLALQSFEDRKFNMRGDGCARLNLQNRARCTLFNEFSAKQLGWQGS